MLTPLRARCASRFLPFVVALPLLASGCALLAPAPAPLQAARLAEIDSAINGVLSARLAPGAVFRMEREGAVYERAYGRQTYADDAPAIGPDTVFDVASLTKVLATSPAIVKLAEMGKLDLDAPLVRYFPQCANGGKEAITVRHLLTHTSGLPASLPGKPAWRGADTALEMACQQQVTNPPGTLFRYSDINYVLLGHLVRHASGQTLDRFTAEQFYGPLKMTQTGFLPLARMPATRIAPTQQLNAEQAAATLHTDLAPAQLLQGVVHDPTARYMGGVGGSAGLFSTAADVARFARMMLNEGELDGVRVLSRDSVRLMSTIQSPAEVLQKRSLGWDIDTPYSRPRGSLYPNGASYGHTGFTGCILWIDPASRSFYVFLSNRVFPNDKANILALYGQLGTLAAQASGHYPAPAVAATK